MDLPEQSLVRPGPRAGCVQIPQTLFDADQDGLIKKALGYSPRYGEIAEPQNLQLVDQWPRDLLGLSAPIDRGIPFSCMRR
ncbi:MAG: hypothetical protein ACYCO3_01295 [Mycobacteriales bacterium]